MALEGDLTEFSLADMLRLLGSGAKTGTLKLERDGETALVCLNEGRVSFAAGPRHGEPLSQRLVAGGIVSESQLRQAVNLQGADAKDQTRRSIAQVLVAEGVVEDRDLELFVRETLFETLFDLFLWDSGTVRFDHDGSCTEHEIGIFIPVDVVLQEMTRRLDEWKRVREGIPSLDALFVIATGPGERSSEIHLSPTEWLVLSELHGGRTVRELMEATGTSDFEMTRTLYSMQVVGLVEMVAVAPPAGATR